MDLDYPIAVNRFREVVLGVRWAKLLGTGIPQIVAQAIAKRGNEEGCQLTTPTKVSTQYGRVVHA